MADPNEISAAFPFESKIVEVHGSRMHYVDEGSGDPILFLHGNPTSSYLWRNIIPHVTPLGRCIAPDLIGMGQSDKPSIGYRFHDHVQYVDGFIEALGLTDVTLVVHDWGSGLGFYHAARHEGNVKGLAFMEAIVAPARWDDFPKAFRAGFRMFRTAGIGWLMIVAMNVFVKRLLPQAVARGLTEAELDYYSQPYRTLASRKPVRQWPLEIPIDGRPRDVYEAVSAYSDWLQHTELPKLLFHATPGGIIREPQVAWCMSHMKNLKAVDIGPGIHYLQEDNPHLIGSELADWYSGISAPAAEI